MRWIDDPSGRFPARPFYEAAELDTLGTALAEEGARRRHRTAPGALDTDALLVLVEAHVGDLDLYADLESDLGPGVEAVTEFRPGRAPIVRVERTLAADPRRRLRLRFTLAHELAHVVLHRELWDRRFAQAQLLPRTPPRIEAVHSRALETPSASRPPVGRADWLEWQAGYLGAALLVPAAAVRVRGRPPFAGTGAGDRLVDAVARGFGVSPDAAAVRLRQLGRLQDPADARQGRLWRE